MSGVNWGIITNQPSGGSQGLDFGNAFAVTLEKQAAREREQRQSDEQKRQFDLSFGLQKQTADRQAEQLGLAKNADARAAEVHGLEKEDRQAKLEDRHLQIFSELSDLAKEAKTPEERQRLLKGIKTMIPGFNAEPWMTEDGWRIGSERLRRIAEAGARKREAEAAALAKTQSEAAENNAKARNLDVQSNSPKADSPEARAAAAQKLGMKPDHPAYMPFVLANKWPRDDQKDLTPSDRKLIADSESQYLKADAAIKRLRTALDLNDKTHTGMGASVRATIGNNLNDWLVPDQLASPESSEATRAYTDIMEQEAVKQMGDDLTGASTDFEMRKYMAIVSDVSKPASIRKDALNRMIEVGERHKQLLRDRMTDIRGGDYFKKDYTPSAISGAPGQRAGATPPPPAPAPQASNSPADPSKMKLEAGKVYEYKGGKYLFKGGDQGDPASWEKQP